MILDSNHLKIRRQCIVRLLIVVGLLLLAGALRLLRLEQLPPGLFIDEGANGMDALRVLQGHHALFFPENQGREGMVIYATALAIALLGRTITAVRLPAALASVGTVLAVFWLGQVLFTERRAEGEAPSWRGLFVGGTAAGILAVSFGYTAIGRDSFRANFLPLFLALSVGFLWIGMRQRSLWRLALAGVFTGLLVYTYLAARFTPLLLLALGLSFLWPASLRPAGLRRYLPLVGFYLAIAGLVALPLVVDFALHPEYFGSRASRLFIFDPLVNKGHPVSALMSNLQSHIGVWGFGGDPNWRHNYASRPLLNLPEALFFWTGLLVASIRWRHPAYRLLPIWLGTFLLPAVLAYEAPANTLRLIGTVPAVYLCIGVGLWHAFDSLARWLRGRSGGGKVMWPYYLATGVVLIMVAGRGISTYRTYNGPWAAHPAVYDTYRSEWTDLMRLVNASRPGSGDVYVIPLGNQFMDDSHEYNFRYLYDHTVPAHILRAAEPEATAQLYGTLIGDNRTEPVRRVRLVDWTGGTHWSGDATGRYAFLLSKYGRRVDEMERRNFLLRDFTDLDLGRPWTLYEQLEPKKIAYDGGMSLTGLAFSRHGGQQASATQPISVQPGESLYTALTWRADQTPAGDYKYSLRLRDAEGGLAFQTDEYLWSFDHAPTSHWQPGDASESLITFELPQDLRPGDYELRLVVYDDKTQTPTVEVGVWQPEATLVRLHVEAGAQ
jgi:4-amino-4-deoxy-L-arabinose transferase-like glycosyltransferase